MIGLDISICSSIFEKCIIVGTDSRIANIERIDILLSLRDTTVECLRESEPRDPIYHSEVDTLGDPPHMTRDLFVFTK